MRSWKTGRGEAEGSLRSVILVHNVTWALRVERMLLSARVACRLVPVPRHLSSDCGVCVRIARGDVPRATVALQEQAADYDAIHDF